MAKKKDKRLGDDPFERFLPQIQDTRKKKDASTNGDGSTSDDAIDDTNEIENKSVINDDYTNENVNNYAYNDKNIINVEGDDVSTIENNDVGTNGDDYERSGAEAFTITKKTKNDNYVRMTYYFRRDQLKAIDQLHKQSGRDKSELVRMAVDALIERARVE